MYRSLAGRSQFFSRKMRAAPDTGFLRAKCTVSNRYSLLFFSLFSARFGLHFIVGIRSVARPCLHRLSHAYLRSTAGSVSIALRRNRGAPHGGAENIPFEPDPDNAGVGRFRSRFTPKFPILCFPLTKGKRCHILFLLTALRLFSQP